MHADGGIYMVERYWSGIATEMLRTAVLRAREAAEDMKGEGRAVRYLRSTLIPADEAAFCLFEASSSEDVAEVNRRAEIPFERITEAVHFAADELEGGLAAAAPDAKAEFR